MACNMVHSVRALAGRAPHARERNLLDEKTVLKSKLAAHAGVPTGQHQRDARSFRRCGCRAAKYSHNPSTREWENVKLFLRSHVSQKAKERTSHVCAANGSQKWRRGQLDTPSVLPEVEIITREGVIRRNAKDEQQTVEKGTDQEEEEIAAQKKFQAPASLAESFAAQQREAERAQAEGMRKRAEELRKGADSGAENSSNRGEEKVSEEQRGDPVKARIEAMKKKALEYKAAKTAAQSESNESSKAKAEEREEASPEAGSSSADGETDSAKSRIEEMQKKAQEYKTSQSAPSETPSSPEAASGSESSDGGGMGAELAMLMSQRRRTEPSPYANVIQPLQRPSEENMPKIEIVTGSQEAVEAQRSDRVLEEEGNAYKPKVATWGVFPRPQNISQAYGGGRTIRPGEALISDEEKAARDKKTMELINAYKKKMGVEMDKDVKERAEKALAAGQELMGRGFLRQSIAYFDDVMKETPFRSEVHGQAMLDKAVALDSLSESDAAKPLYERLSQHPKVHIQRKASQMLFGFAAAEKLKFSKSKINSHDPSVYQRYLSRFSNGYDNTYAPSVEELERSAKEAGRSQLFALAVVGAPLVMIGALIAARGS